MNYSAASGGKLNPEAIKKCLRRFAVKYLSYYHFCGSTHTAAQSWRLQILNDFFDHTDDAAILGHKNPIVLFI